MGRWSRIGLLLLVVAGCAPHVPEARHATLAWDFSARPTRGEVRVVPVLVDVAPPTLALDTFLGAPLTRARAQQRLRRTHQLEEVPAAVGLAVPGAVTAALGSDWDGTFHVGALPSGGYDRWLSAVRGRGDLEQTLTALAREVGGDASLFVWVDRLEGRPVSAVGFPGDLVCTAAGPVIVDHGEEIYQVTARVGVALVASDGEIVLRYVDVFDALLSDRSDPEQAGRDLARGVAAEIEQVWPSDPRLLAAEPHTRKW